MQQWIIYGSQSASSPRRMSRVWYVHFVFGAGSFGLWTTMLPPVRLVLTLCMCLRGFLILNNGVQSLNLLYLFGRKTCHSNGFLADSEI